MSYLVLARKYRPQTFSEVVGQEHVTRTLANAFEQGRVHHAFLFCGPRGVGKTTAARILGKALNCERGPTASPCGTCSACTSIADGTAVDYREMDGASNRGIDSIRELTEAVRYQPAMLRKKVYVIDEVHMLTTEAFNALLKTLEEPPPHVTFVMATTEPHKLPNTILSRCQRYDFKLVPGVRLAEHLQSIFAREELKVDSGAVGLMVRESGGSVRDCLSIADQVISYAGDQPVSEALVAEVLGVADRALTRGMVAALAEGDARTALESVDAAVTRGVDEVQIARALVRFLRDVAVLQAAPGADGLIDGSAEEKADLAALAKTLDRARVTQMFERLVRACDDLGETHMPRMVLDLALIDLAAIEPIVPLGDLLSRLGDMERRLGGAAPRTRMARRSVRPPTPRRDPAPAASSPVPVPVPVPEQAQSSKPEPPSPPPPPTTATRPSPPADPLSEWTSIIDELAAARKLKLVGVLQNARLASWTADAISISFPAGSLDAEVASDRENVNFLRGLLSERYGRRIAVDVRTHDEADTSARSILEVAADRANEERERREREAREHPTTKLVLDTFGAKIKEIKTDG